MSALRVRFFRVFAASRSRLLWLAALGVVLSACGSEAVERVDSIYALKRSGSPADLERIRTFLDDPDKDVRSTALFVLVTSDVSDARALALEGASDGDAFVRMTAADLLGEVGTPDDVDVLSRLALSDEDDGVRMRAAESLGEIGDAGARPALARALGDPIAAVRKASAISLARVGVGDYADALARAVRSDPEWEVRVQSVRALVTTGDRKVLPVLSAALDDENEFVRAAAANAVRRIEQAPEPEPPPSEAGAVVEDGRPAASTEPDASEAEAGG